MTDVQDAWNDFENKLIKIVDSIAPMSKFQNDSIFTLPNRFIIRKRNLRKRLIKQFKRNPTLDLKARIKQLNVEIKCYFFSEKRSKVRRNIIPGNTKSLWRAVNLNICKCKHVRTK